MVFSIKFIHALLFLIMEGSLGYILYCGITNQANLLSWIMVGGMVVESIILIVNSWRCPLTDLAERYGAEDGSVTGIFLPRFLVPHVFRIYGGLFILGIVLLIV
ncbi:MAG: hypothetical protein ACXADO_06450 [Candidatus Thorarchaeota archaeon]|jgi:hypothetical protein